MKIHIVDGLQCPNCGAPELDPRTANPDGSYKTGARWVIRPFKVDMASQCLRCAGILDENFDPIPGRSLDNPKYGNRGWFE